MTSLPKAQNPVLSCPECAWENPPGETFCVQCGYTLAGEGDPFPPLPAGTVLAEKYTLTSCLGSPEAENLYHARRLGEGETLLLVRERRSAFGVPRKALLGRLKDLSHPALPRLWDYFEQGGRFYTVQEAISGIPLGSRVGKTTEREALGWGIQLCQLLGFLHRQGILCPGLSPEALLVDPSGRLCLTRWDALQEKGAQSGAVALWDGYTAPEAYKAGTLDERADLFALGATLYSLLVGKRLAVEGWISAYEPPLFYPEKVLSPALERVVLKALALQPEQRYGSAEALKADLLVLGQGVRLRSGWYMDRGMVRDHNEDSVLVVEKGQYTEAGSASWGLYAVSDGMGGAECGEVASALTVQTLAQHIEAAGDGALGTKEEREVLLCRAVEAAHREILRYAREHPEAAGMGATVVVGMLGGCELTLAWVGDSRAYLWEGGRLLRLSRDHSLVERLVEIGQLSPAEARTHEHRHVLLRSLGGKEQVAVECLSRTLKRGSRLLFCSDGLTAHVEEWAVADILSRHRDPQGAALELVVAANAGGGSDNTAVVVVFIE